jgi:hypothetical protein
MKLTELNKLFQIDYGNKLDLNKMKVTGANEDAIDFVGRSGEKNGIVAYVEKLTHIEPYPAGYITVALGGAALSSFVQARPFYTAQNIAILQPLTDMTLNTKLYYCLCIEANRYRYSTFGREANRTLRTLLVPTIASIPTWCSEATKNSIKQLKHDLEKILTDS